MIIYKLLFYIFFYLQTVLLDSGSDSNLVFEGIKNILESIAAAFIGLGAVFARMIDSFALRNPYPCYASPQQGARPVDKFAMECGPDGMAQPELFPIVFGEDKIFAFVGAESNRPDTFAEHPWYGNGGWWSFSNDPGFWGSLAEAHVSIIAASVMLLVLGTGITYALYAVGWGVSDQNIEDMGVYNIIKTGLLIIFWWPIASIILWIAEGFNLLMVNFFTISNTGGSTFIDELRDALYNEYEIHGETYLLEETTTYSASPAGGSGLFSIGVASEWKVFVNGEDATEELFGSETVSDSNSGIIFPWNSAQVATTEGVRVGVWKSMWDKDATYVFDWSEYDSFTNSDNDINQTVKDIANVTDGQVVNSESSTASSSVYVALDSVSKILQSEDVEGPGGIGGSFLFIILMIFLIIPYILIGLVLVIFWLFRVIGIVIIFLIMPLALSIQKFKFRGMASLSGTAERAFPLFMFLVIISIPVSLFGGLSILMIEIVDSLMSSVSGMPDFVRSTIFLLFVMWLPMIYGAMPFLLAKYTSFNPVEDFDNLKGGKITNLENYDVKSIAEGDSDKGLKKSIKSGDLAGTLEAASGKGQATLTDRLGMEDKDNLNEAIRSKGTENVQDVGENIKEKTEKKAVDARTAFEEEGKTLENYKQRQEERAEKRTKKKARENKEEAKEQAGDQHAEMVDKKMEEDAMFTELEDQVREEDLYDYRSDLGNKVFDDVEEFDEEVKNDMDKLQDEMKRQLGESLANDSVNMAPDDILQSLDSVDLDMGSYHSLEDEESLGQAIMDSESTLTSEEMRELEEAYSDDELESTTEGSKLVERLSKDGRLQDEVLQMMRGGKVEFTAELKDQKDKTFHIHDHLQEHDLDMDELTPDKSLSEEALEQADSYEDAKRYQKALDKQSERLQEKSEETVKELANVKTDVKEGALEYIKEGASNYIDDEIENIDGIDEDASDEEKWEAYFQRKDDIDIEEIVEELEIDKDSEVAEEFVESWKEAKEDEDLDDKSDWSMIMSEAESEASEELQLQVDDISDYADVFEGSDAGEEVFENYFEDKENVDSPEDIVQEYNEETMEKQLQMLGLTELDSIESAKRVVEQDGVNNETVMKNFVDNIEEQPDSDNMKKKLHKLGEKIEAIEAKEDVDVDDVFGSKEED